MPPREMEDPIRPAPLVGVAEAAEEEADVEELVVVVV